MLILKMYLTFFLAAEFNVDFFKQLTVSAIFHLVYEPGIKLDMFSLLFIEQGYRKNPLVFFLDAYRAEI